MAIKSTIALIIAACCIQYIAAQTQYFSIGSSRSEDSGEARRVTYVQQPQRVVYVNRPAEESAEIRYRPAPAPQVVYRPAPAPQIVYKPAPAPQIAYKPAPAPQIAYRPAPAVQRVAYRQRDSGEYGNDDAKYQFAYRVVAAGNGGYGDSQEGGYGGAAQEFGHSESRDGAKTTGSYFTQLPDGRLQKVDYYVDGPSGYVARVSYSAAGTKGYSAGQSSEK